MQTLGSGSPVLDIPRHHSSPSVDTAHALLGGSRDTRPISVFRFHNNLVHAIVHDRIFLTYTRPRQDSSGACVSVWAKPRGVLMNTGLILRSAVVILKALSTRLRKVEISRLLVGDLLE